jgi:hypothetical protein
MANPYTGSSITGCNSPAVGADKDTYTGSFDAQAEAIDNHDHTSGKGKPIGTNALSDGAVTTAKLGTGAATSTKIADGAVTTAKIADSNVTTSKIANDAVTTAKIPDGAITPAKLASSTIKQRARSAPVSFSATNPSAQAITGLTVTLTPNSTLVRLRLDGGLIREYYAAAFVGSAGTYTAEILLDFYRDGYFVGSVRQQISVYVAAGFPGPSMYLSPASFQCEDQGIPAITPGVACTYTVEISGTNVCELTNVSLIAEEV